jgi:hypothetical protein
LPQTMTFKLPFLRRPRSGLLINKGASETRGALFEPYV